MKNILVIWDHNDSSGKLLEKANRIALPFLAKIQVVVFVNAVYGKKFTENNNVSLADNVKNQLAEKFNQSLKVKSTIVVDHDIARWVKQNCDTKKVDLVIKTGNRSENMFHTPTDWQLIRQVNCPVLIASAKKWKAKSRILATVDLVEKNKNQEKINTKTLVTAEHFAAKNNSALHVAYSIPITKALTELDIVEPSDVLAKKGKKMEQVLDKVILRCKIKSANKNIVAGDVADTIPKLAHQLKADLVVMGSIGRTGVKGLLLGNTAERVIHNLRTDVLVIKP
ncbi:hypothetical protein NBRC116493_08520 [Aurantivibrio infirmus]